MKGQAMWYGIIVVIVLLVAGTWFMGMWTISGVIPTGCRIIKPVWGYYNCELSDIESVHATRYATLPGGNYYYPCTNLDIAPNEMNKPDGTQVSCVVGITVPTSGQATCQICNGPICRQRLLLSSDAVYLMFGESVSCSLLGPVFGSFKYDFVAQYRSKQLIYHDWYGYESQTKGVGCDIRAILSPEEWEELPTSAKQSLQVGERENFIVDWIDQPVFGNFFTHPVHGPVICTPQHVLYSVSPYMVDEAGEEGVYYDQGGNCYLIPSANPVESNVDCCPGETLQGYVCDNSCTIGPIDQGDCCRGGICSAIYCAGGGGRYCDLPTHRAFDGATCEQSTGTCLYQNEKYAMCCPPEYGCAGDEYCHPTEYVCKKKEPGLIACDFECCTADTIDLSVYQEKQCADTALTCCPDHTCKVICGGGGDDDGPAQEDINTLITIMALLFGIIGGFIGYLYKGIKGAIILGVVGVLIGYLTVSLVLPIFQQILDMIQVALNIGETGMDIIDTLIFWD